MKRLCALFLVLALLCAALPACAEQTESTVIVDDANCTFTITGMEQQDEWGYFTLKVFLENKTDVNLCFNWRDAAVNGVMCDPFWACTVPAGLKSNEEISFSWEALEEAGMDEVLEIVFELEISDDDDWEAEPLVDDTFVFYPLGEAAYEPAPRQRLDTDVVLFENESCSATVLGFHQDEFWGYGMKLYLENKTETELMFSADDVAVNGFLCDPYWATTVMAGMGSYTAIYWELEDLENNGITPETVEEIRLQMTVYDNEDWSADNLVEEVFTVTLGASAEAENPEAAEEEAEKAPSSNFKSGK